MTMRFMVLRKADTKTEAGVMPSEQLLSEMGKYMEEMAKAGIVLGGEGLQPSSKGARIRFSGGKPMVIDGPFIEIKELIAGYMMIQVKSREEAIEWMKRWPASDADGNVEIEIRQIYENNDFGAELTPEIREREERLRKELSKKE
jgi:hypothetical protein